MNEKTLTHWKKLVNPDYLGAYAFDEGKDKTLTIGSVANEEVMGADGKKETCMVMRWVEQEKPLILNVTNAKTIQKLLKTPFIEKWAGNRIQLFVQTGVKAFGDTVDAVRIRNFLPKAEQTFVCSDCKNPIAAANNMTPERMAEYTKSKYGRQLCASCAIKAKSSTPATEPEKTKEETAE